MTLDVASIPEAHAGLPWTPARFREGGLLAQAMIFKRRRAPEAVLLPYPHYEILAAATASPNLPEDATQGASFVRGNPPPRDANHPDVAQEVA